ncbi:major capsid protein [Photobacterium sp. OFAV2-7]|uniref:major capsid protein n=1 Tax=Photobacterium sp. OFAV2-7 TaxID=2917748 RepID=UPI001EF6C920|nr:major capsid protein [Photobacterium sp. OFAV2-7]MCG7588390.1 major capsid protein [Photobacterium sp. OFAV2-7]
MDKIFDHEAFSLVALTTGYNSSTPIESDVLNMFKVENVENRQVMIVKSGNELQVLMPGEIGQHPNIDKHDPESAVPVSLIRYPFDSQIVASELNRISSLRDKKLQAQELAGLVKTKMGKHRDNHRYTSAFTAYSALKGRVKNRKGVVMVDLFQVLGVEERRVDLKLGSDTTDVPKKLKAISKETKKIAKEHGHMMIKGVAIRVGQDLIERIISHKSIKEFYGPEAHPKLQVKFADDPSGISLCGLTFITDEADEVAEDGASYPLGVNGVFGMLRAPADVLSSSSASKRECHITTEPMPHDEGLEIRSRSIYLPITRDPALLCAVHSSN